MMSDEDFSEELQIVDDNTEIPYANNYTPEVLEYNYDNLGLYMLLDSEGPYFEHVTKRIWDSNGIQIETANKNTIWEP